MGGSWSLHSEDERGGTCSGFEEESKGRINALDRLAAGHISLARQWQDGCNTSQSIVEGPADSAEMGILLIFPSVSAYFQEVGRRAHWYLARGTPAEAYR